MTYAKCSGVFLYLSNCLRQTPHCHERKLRIADGVELVDAVDVDPPLSAVP